MTEETTVESGTAETTPIESVETSTVETTTTETTTEPISLFEKLQQKEDSPSPQAETATSEKETDNDVVVDPSIPSESAEAETEAEEESETVDYSALPRFSRKELRDLEKSVINPIRDPNTTAEQMYEALAEFNPQRADQLAEYVVNSSVKQHPDAWAKAITGIEEITVDEIKNLWSKRDAVQSASSTSTETDGLKPITDFLDSYYGEEWRDANNDDSIILDDHLAMVKLAREQVDFRSKESAEIKTLREELEAVKRQKDELQPKVDEIAEQQRIAFENEIEQTYIASTTDYINTIEKSAVEKVFKQMGLSISPDDSPQVKALKEQLLSEFEVDGDSSGFRNFVIAKSGSKEALVKIITRVDERLKNEAKAKVQSTRAKDTEKSKLLRQAEIDRQEAEREKDSLSVLTQNAAKEFISKKYETNLAILKENAELKRQIAQIAGSRVELVGQESIAGNADAWKQALAENPDQRGVLFNRLQANRR